MMKELQLPGTQGSICVLVKSQGKKVLFGQDLYRPFNDGFLSDLQAYHQSMQKLLDLSADIPREGYFGVFQPAGRVREDIETYKKNESSETAGTMIKL